MANNAASQTVSYQDNDEVTNFDDKVNVECICPKCGANHILMFHWIGRGKPRKYCRLCRQQTV